MVKLLPDSKGVYVCVYIWVSNFCVAPSCFVKYENVEFRYLSGFLEVEVYIIFYATKLCLINFDSPKNIMEDV